MGAQGTATLNFGAFPGSSEASIAVTGQAALLAGSLIEAWRMPVATADKTIDEQAIERLRVIATDIIAGTGFIIRGYDDASPAFKLPQGDQAQNQRIYGQYNIGWAWN
jgi:hypothetical protein